MTLPSAGRLRISLGAAATIALSVAVLTGIAPPASADTAPPGGHAAHTVLKLHDGIALVDASYTLNSDGPASDKVPGQPASGDAGLLAWTTYTDYSTTEMTSGMQARIVDYGATTPFWVQVHTRQWLLGTPDDEYHFEADCAIYRGDPSAGGTILDQDAASPYACPSIAGDAPLSSSVDGNGYEVLTRELNLTSLVWAQASGLVTASGQVSLLGVQDNASGVAPIESTVPESTIVRGQALSLGGDQTSVTADAPIAFRASQRNGYGADPEHPRDPKVTVEYRILYDGAPTVYWMRAEVSNARRAGVFFGDADCTIYLGDPDGAGAGAAITPYNCDVATGGSGAEDYGATFTVSRSVIQPLGSHEAASMVKQYCTGPDAASTCAYQASTVESYNEDPQSQPDIHGVDGVDNPTPTAAWDQYEYDTARTVQNSVEVSSSVKSQVFFDLFSASFHISYTYSTSSETTTKQTYGFNVPPGCHADIQFAPAYLKVHGDYFLYVDGTWYSAENVTWRLPDYSAAYGGDIKPVLTQLQGSAYACPTTGQTGSVEPGTGGGDGDAGTASPAPRETPTASATPSPSASATPVATASAGSQLPVTGADSRPVAGAALVLLLAGAAVLGARAAARRRRG